MAKDHGFLQSSSCLFGTSLHPLSYQTQTYLHCITGGGRRWRSRAGLLADKRSPGSTKWASRCWYASCKYRLLGPLEHQTCDAASQMSMRLDELLVLAMARGRAKHDKLFVERFLSFYFHFTVPDPDRLYLRLIHGGCCQFSFSGRRGGGEHARAQWGCDQYYESALQLPLPLICHAKSQYPGCASWHCLHDKFW